MRRGPQGEAWQGGGVPADGCGTAGAALLQRVGTSRGLARAVMGLGTALRSLQTAGGPRERAT
jgi:hypothetical protein